MDEVKKKLQAALIELQDAAGKMQDEIDNFDPPEGDEDATSPFEDTSSYLSDAIINLEDCMNSFPSE